MLQFWDKATALIFPNGRVCSPDEVIQDYQFMETVKTVIEVAGGVTISIHPLPVMIQRFGLDESKSDDELLAGIERGLANDRDPNYSVINEILDIIEGGAEI